MTEYLYPNLPESGNSLAISSEAQFVIKNFENSHYLFLNGSLYIQSVYKQQLKEKFEAYTSIWITETMFSSSVHEIINNSAYRSIVKLGKDVIPFIIEELKKEENHWFYALEALTGQNPIKQEHRGIIRLMKSDWIEWAEKNNNYDVDTSCIS